MFDSYTMENSDKLKILVVDDEDSICEVLQYNLLKNGYLVDVAHSGEEALTLLKSKKYNLLLLDVMLGGISGIGLAQVLREDYQDNTPIIFLSALDTEPDILRGFKSGGDDYIAKPFSINQVIARVGAVLKRSSNSNSTLKSASEIASVSENKQSEEVNKEKVIKCGNLSLNIDQSKVYIDKKEIALTKTEFNI